MKGSIKVFRGLLEGWVVSVFAFTATAIAQAPFCDDFEDGNGWQSRWTNIYGAQTLVSSPTHSGTGALEFRGTGQPSFECHSVLQRNNFQADEGEYSAWFNQQHFEAGLWINIQVQPDPDAHPSLRPSYELNISAQNSQGGSFVLARQDGLGGAVILLNVAPQFNMNEWIRAFIKRKLPDTLIVGYERNAQVYSYVVVDPNPITASGGFYISSCSDGPATDNFYDDVCFTPLSPTASAIPTLSEWGLIFFGLLLLGTIVFYVRWRKLRTQPMT